MMWLPVTSISKVWFDRELPGINQSIEVEPMIPPATSGREQINDNEPTETPDIAQEDRMDEDDVAEIFAPSEAEDDADIADFLMVNALIGAGVDRTCAELHTNTICAVQDRTSLIEVYGRGHIMAQANGPKRSLKITG